MEKYGVPIVFLVVFAVCVVSAWRGTYPEPVVHDEFSYLLAADTYAHGRLTNPAHPHWEHFESFHIIAKPSYVSKYPAAPGLVLALGKLLFGHPIFGAWLAVAAAAAAIFWMLRIWFPPWWALAGTVIPTVRMLLLWTDNYWVSTLPVLGGALLFGGFVKLTKEPRIRYSVLLGIGVAILATSRPFEGLLMTLPVGVALLVWAGRKLRSRDRRSVFRAVLPAAVVVGLTLTWMAYYNYRTTGDARTMAYSIYTDEYIPAGEFAVMPRKEEPDYRHAEFRAFARWRLDAWEASRERFGFNGPTWWKARKFFKFYIGSAMLLPLIIGLTRGFRSHRGVRFAVVTCLTVMLGSLVAVNYFPRYFAPILGVTMVPLVYGLREISEWRWRDRPAGRRIAIGLVLVYAVLLPPWMATRLSPSANAPRNRTIVADRLENVDGNHLVVVRYRPGHSLHDEWVYNDADLEESRIVWARNMDPARNGQLIDYFSDRRIWLVELGESSVSLVPYPR